MTIATPISNLLKNVHGINVVDDQGAGRVDSDRLYKEPESWYAGFGRLNSGRADQRGSPFRDIFCLGNDPRFFAIQ